MPTGFVGRFAAALVTSGEGIPVQGALTRAKLYPLCRSWASLGAIALGDIVLYSPAFLRRHDAAAVIAHELAHTQQHHVLGPFYLPLHGIAQSISAILSLLHRGPVQHSRVHDFNPLEQTFIHIGVGCIAPLARGELLSAERRDELYALYGLTPSVLERLESSLSPLAAV